MLPLINSSFSYRSLFVLILLLFLSDRGRGKNYKKLSRLNIEPGITVSGLSGGGSFSMMLSFIYSSFVKGAGVFAGGPYPVGIILVESPAQFFNFTHHTVWINYLASRGFIDDPRNLKNFRAYVYHGAIDHIVPAFLSRFNVGLFRHYGVRHLKDMVAKIPSTHCYPTSSVNDHRICSISVVAVCGCGYSGVEDMFSTLYPETWVNPRLEIGQETSGTLFKFDQNEFFDTKNATFHGWKEFGYAYIPYRCRPESGIVCKLHFAFHGCGQNIIHIILKVVPNYIAETGYLEAADANDIVIIFPQAFPDLTGTTLNIIGCFDLYGYTSPFRITYATKYGVQPLAVKKMYERILMGTIN